MPRPLPSGPDWISRSLGDLQRQITELRPTIPARDTIARLLTDLEARVAALEQYHAPPAQPSSRDASEPPSSPE